MSLRDVPPRIRAHIYLYYVGMALGALGLVGFVLSFSQVGSAAQALVDVHDDVPVLAYASIAAWVAGLATMWYSRRTLNAAVREKMRQDRVGALLGPEDGADRAATEPAE